MAMAVKHFLLAAAMTPLAMGLTLKATEQSMSIKVNMTGDMQATTASDGIYIALKSHWGKFVVAEKNGDLNANRDRVGEWERFEMITHKGTDKMSLKSIHGKYVVAEKNGDCHANRDVIGSWEKFKMITHRDGTLSFKSAHGKYVVAEKNGHLNANRAQASSWEKFKVVYVAKPPVKVTKPVATLRVALKTSHGKFFVAGKDGKMNANGNDGKINANEQFTMYTHKDGLVSFKSAHGKYMVAEKNGHCNANRDWMRSWEKFKIIKTGDCALSCTVSLKTAHNKYVVAESDGRLNANRAAAQSWEKFELMNLDAIAAKTIADAKAAALKKIADAKAAEAARLKAIADAAAAKAAAAKAAADAEAARLKIIADRKAAIIAKRQAKAKALAEKIAKRQARLKAIRDRKAAALKKIADAKEAAERKIFEAFKARELRKVLGNRRGVCHAGIFQPAGWFANAQAGQNVFTAACLGAPHPHGQQLCSSVAAELFSHFNAQGRKGMKVPFTTKTVPDSTHFCKSLYRLLQAHKEWLAGRSKKAMRDRSLSLPVQVKKLDHTTQGKAVDKKMIHALLQTTDSEDAVDADLIEDVAEDSETVARADDLEEVEEGGTDETVDDDAFSTV